MYTAVLLRCGEFQRTVSVEPEDSGTVDLRARKSCTPNLF